MPLRESVRRALLRAIHASDARASPGSRWLVPGLEIDPSARRRPSPGALQRAPGGRAAIAPRAATEHRPGALSFLVHAGGEIVVEEGAWLRTEVAPCSSPLPGARLVVGPRGAAQRLHGEREARGRDRARRAGRPRLARLRLRPARPRQRAPRARSRRCGSASWAWVASDVTVMRGVTIGAHAVIGARSLVTRDVPPHTLAFGTPAEPRGSVGDRTERVLRMRPSPRVLRAGAVRARRARAAARSGPRGGRRLRAAAGRAARSARRGGGEARAAPAPPRAMRRKGAAIPERVAEHAALGAELNVLAFVTMILPDRDRGRAAPRLALLPSLAAAEVPRRQRARLADPARRDGDGRHGVPPRRGRRHRADRRPERRRRDRAAAHRGEPLLRASSTRSASRRWSRRSSSSRAGARARAAGRGARELPGPRDRRGRAPRLVEERGRARPLDPRLRPEPRRARASRAARPCACSARGSRRARRAARRRARVLAVAPDALRIAARGGALEVAKLRVGAGAKVAAGEAGIAAGERLS